MNIIIILCKINVYYKYNIIIIIYSYKYLYYKILIKLHRKSISYDVIWLKILD